MPSRKSITVALLVVLVSLFIGYKVGTYHPDQDAVALEVNGQLETRYLLGKSDALKQMNTLMVKECEDLKKKNDPEAGKFIQ